MAWWTVLTLGISVVIPVLWVREAQAGDTTCVSNQMDWYTSVVGESPCVTYQRLRQICNNDYQVPAFRPNTPGDQCDDQVSECCCNTVAFQLSMLCMNCQYDTVDGDISSGIDAGVGAYTLYRASCGAGVNNSLPTDIQTAVCNEGIRLDNFVYGGWADGSWYYVWTKENAERDHAANNNNTFTVCPNEISPSPTPTPSSTPVSSSTHNPPPLTATSSTPTPSTPSPSSTPAPSSTRTTSSMPTDSSLSNSASNTTATGTSQSQSSTSSADGPSQTAGGLTNNSNGNNDSNGNNNDSSNNTSYSKTNAIVGGVVGGVGAIAIAVAAFVFWRIRTHRSTGAPTTQDQHFDYTYHSASGQDSPAMSSATPFAASVGMGDSAASLSLGSTPLWSPGRHSSGLLGPFSPGPGESADRHEDGGPVVDLDRSASGRLPPAYRSWEMISAGSNAGSVSNAGSEALGGRLLPVPPSAPFEGAPGMNMPLVPQRRSLEPRDTKEDLG